MEKFVFFTMNDFQKEGGGTIRMLGIINELAKLNTEIVLISNIHNPSKVNSKVKHIPIGIEFSRQDKRKFQFYLGTLDYKKLNQTYPELKNRLNSIFQELDRNPKFIFFEYLDNSIGYWLKKNEVIKGYVNDIHGIASNEFDFQAKRAKSLFSKFLLRVKKKISKQLDKRVFESADGIIYASEAMRLYFMKLYPSLKEKENYHLPYLLNHQNVNPPNIELVNQLKKDLNIQSTDFVFLFAGAFKETGGVQDLIAAFGKVTEEHTNAKLILIGDGPAFEECKNLISSMKHSDAIHQLGRQPYDHLTSYQELSHVLVCPDRQNLFSDLIVHVKYLDALASGKLVINGSFKSVVEINQTKELSLLFRPSDIQDLTSKMIRSIEDYESLSYKFSASKDYTLNNLNYTNYISNLVRN